MADANFHAQNWHTEAWKDKPWKKFQRVVFRLQKRIYRAEERGDRRTVHKLQALLQKSRAARFLAVRRVTQENRGKRTAGIDGVAFLKPSERLILAENLKNMSNQADPIRRIYIPKPNKKEQRPLGIPTMKERARQTLVKFALEPQWEAKFEANSYGFRPGRSAHDAIAAIYSSINKLPKYVLDTDIENCFDRINHNYLLDKLNTYPSLRRQIKAWLKAGIMENQISSIPKAGTPQGSPLSPSLMNIALHGLEETIVNALPKTKNNLPWHPTLVRYADDLVILHRDLETLHYLRKEAENFLSTIGLRLKPSKTRITHTLEPHQGNVGFNFLGFEIRQYKVSKYRSGKNGDKSILGFKTVIKPSKESQLRHLESTGEIIKRYRGQSQDDLIRALTPIIVGWRNYYQHVVSKKVFSIMDHRLHQQLVSWTKWRHKHKSHRWRMYRYWHRISGRLEFSNQYKLPKHNDTEIKRHIKISGKCSPYDGDWLYWSRRLPAYQGLSPQKQKLLKRQNGKCEYCELYFKIDDHIQVHHIDRARENNHYTNLMLVHLSCHHIIHGSRDKTLQIEKPDDGNLSRPVLQRQEAG
jgi:RNA-directed DNA polymerase